MAKDKLTQYDTTASNNTDVGGISVAEGMLPSGVNNAIREQMSHLADFAAGTSGVDVLKLQDDTDTNSIKLQAPASVTANTTFTMPDGDGTADQVLKTDGSGQLGFADRHPNPSLIINGAMTISQRGTSSTSSGYQTVDRFRNDYSGASVTQSQQVLSSGDPYDAGFRYFYRHSNTATSSATSAQLQVFQFVEAQNVAGSGWNYTSTSSNVTVSFWVRSSLAGTYVFNMQSVDGTAQNYSSQFTLSADTWTKVIKTIPGNSNLQFDNNAERGMWVNIMVHLGTDYTDSGFTHDSWAAYSGSSRAGDFAQNWANTASATFDITGVKLEVGSTATDFVHEDYGTTLAKCLRYYEEWGGDNAYQPIGYFEGTGTVGYGVLQYFVEKRDPPTVTATAATDFHSIRGNVAFSSISFGAASTTQVLVSISRTTNNWTDGQVFSWRTNNSTTARIYFNAEL